MEGETMPANAVGEYKALRKSAAEYLNDGLPGREDRYGLSARRWRVVAHWVLYEDRDAALDAGGYSTVKADGTAWRTWARFLDDPLMVRAMVLERWWTQQQTLRERDRLIEQLTDTVLADPLQVYDSTGAVRPLNEIPAAVRRTLASIEQTGGGRGRPERTRVRLGDRNAAARLLLQHHGMLRSVQQHGEAVGKGLALASMLSTCIEGEHETLSREDVD
jgi:hypothetical protein